MKECPAGHLDAGHAPIRQFTMLASTINIVTCLMLTISVDPHLAVKVLQVYDRK